MKKKHLIIGGLIAAFVVVIYYALKGQGPTAISYPNTQASGVPVSQAPATAYTFGSPQALPSPDLIYGPPPALPATPTYQSYNYPGNFTFGLTPDASMVAPALPAKPSAGCGCGCNDQSQGVYSDGALLVGVAANRTEQVQGGKPGAAPSSTSSIVPLPSLNLTDILHGMAPVTNLIQ